MKHGIDKFEVLIDRPGLFLIIDDKGRMREWWTLVSVVGDGWIPWRTAL